MNIERITPVLLVDAIEPLLSFWVDRLGFTKTVEVPHEDKLGFVILVRNDEQIMLQTRASVAVDLPSVGKLAPPISLYIDVDSIDATAPLLKGTETLVPLRTTPYGAREIFVRTPDGQILGFAEHKS